MPFHEIAPPYEEHIWEDSEGNLWVKEHVPYAPRSADSDTATPADKWIVIDRTGLLLGTVDLPARFMPYEIGTDFLLGVASGEHGVQRVARYRLVKPEARARTGTGSAAPADR